MIGKPEGLFFLYESNLIPIMEIAPHGSDFAIRISGQPLTKDGEINEMPIICSRDVIFRQKLH